MEGPILYVKPGCPWCHEALSYLNRHGIKPVVKDVIHDAAARQRMHEVTKQTLTPSLEFGEFVVADFSVSELEAELNRHPEVRQQLGFRD